MRRALPFSLLFTLLLASASATEGAGPGVIRRDLYGDPLPPGAVARLGTVRLRHADTGDVPVNGLAFTRDGKGIVTCGGDGILSLWAADTGVELRRFGKHENQFQGLALSPDGKLLASRSPRNFQVINKELNLGTWDLNLRTWDLATGRPLATFGPDVGCREDALAFSPDSRLLVSAGYGIQVWQASSGKLIRRMGDPSKSTKCVGFTADGQGLVSVGEDGVVRFWGLTTGHETRTADRDAKGAAGLALSPDGRQLAFLGHDAVLRLRDLDRKTTRVVAKVPVLFLFRRGGGLGPATLTFSPDGKTLALGSWHDFPLQVVSVTTGKVLRAFGLDTVPTWNIVFSPDGQTLAVSGVGRGGIRLLSVRSGRDLVPRRVPEHPVSPVALSPDGRRLAFGRYDAEAFLWEVGSPDGPRRLYHRKDRGGPDTSSYQQHLAFSADGQVLLNVGAGEMSLWQVVNGRRLRYFPEAHARCFANSAHGLIAAREGDRGLQVVQVRSGKVLSQLEETNQARSSVGPFTPDGTLLVTGAEMAKGEVKYWEVSLWEVGSGKLLRRLRWPGESSPRSLAISPDGRALAGAGPDVILLVDATTGSTLAEIRGGEKKGKSGAPFHSPGFEVATFSPDGRTLASGGKDGVVRLWEVATGRQRSALAGHRGFVEALAFSANGKRLASGGADMTALVWDLTGRARWGSEGRTTAELAGLWDDLAGDDAARAYRAIQQLALAPEAAVPFLAGRLRPATAADPKEAAKLTAERLRELRALEALEHASTAAAQQALARLAKGHPGARLTREARASLDRLRNRARAAE